MVRLSKAERRDQIKELTLDLIGSRPLSAIRTAEIAERCGVSEAVLYHHFAGKDALFEEIIQDWVSRRFPIPESSAYDSPQKFRDYLDNYFAILASETPFRRAQLRLMLQISMDRHPLAKAKYRQVVSGIWTFMEERLRHGQEHWGFRKDLDIPALVRHLYMGILMNHIEQDVFGVADYDPQPSASIRRMALDMFFAYLECPAKS